MSDERAAGGPQPAAVPRALSPDRIGGRVTGALVRQWIRTPELVAHRTGMHVNELRDLLRGEPVTAAPATGESA